MNWTAKAGLYLTACTLFALSSCGNSSNEQIDAAVRLSAISGATSERGTQAMFSVVLSRQPSANVTLSLASSDPSEGTISAASLTFTKLNWNAPQTVTVTGVDDHVDDGSKVYNITFTATKSADSAFNALSLPPIPVTNIDDETAGVTVSAISQPTTETGGQATFTVVLNSEPTADVTLNLASNDVGEGTTNTSSVSFTATNWNAPQTVTVTGVNDDVDDGNQLYSIAFSATTSSDTTYAAITPNPVAVANLDDETAGVTLTAMTVPTTETGGQATFTAVLNSEPTADVTLNFASNDLTEGTTGVQLLTFTPTNWKAPQTVTVTGVNDSIADGNQVYSVVFAATTSTDSAYAAITPTDIIATNIDDETAGITVGAISGPTTEAGGTATFTAVLNSQPSANVQLNFATNDPTEGTTGVANLTFTAANWNAPQTVTVTGVDDNLADGSQPYAIVFAATASSDPNYAPITPNNVVVTNLDDETAGITIGAISRPTTEAGGTATFAAVLNSQPTADVTLNFATNDATEGTTGVANLTFTPVNWNAPQTVTVTGVDDNLADGTQAYAIVFAATTSVDTAYAAITPANVLASNADDETAGVTISPISAPTTEAGGTATFTAVLGSQPTANVTLNFATTDATEGTTGVTSLTFTPANWNATQTVTVTGQNDNVADGTQTYSIAFGPTTSTDAAYAAITPTTVLASNLDDETAGVTVGTISQPTTETGGTATFTAVLNSQPTANVTLNFASNDATEGVAGVGSLTFTPANWNATQTVTVTGQNDNLADGTQTYAIVFAATTSTDAAYAAILPSSVGVANLDDETAGINISAISQPTTEAGGTATFTAVLSSQPTADVTLNFATNDATEGTTGVASVTFTPANWNAMQTVTVTGQDDNLADGAQAYSIAFAATTSTDAAYAAITPTSIAVTNLDDETAGINISAISRPTTETGGTATFTAVLSSQPTANVTLNFATSDATEGTTGVASLTFTPANWNATLTVTVTGQDDAIADGTQAYNVTFAATTSADAAYAGITPASIAVTNLDNESAGITLSPISQPTTEGNGTATFTAVLNSQPAANVTLHFTSNDLTEGTIGVATLTFTPVNWAGAQTVTVTGANDNVADGTQTYAIVFTATTSADAKYSGLIPANVVVSNLDDETAGINVSAISRPTTEGGGTATLTIVLNSQPTGSVIVNLVSNDPSEGVTNVPNLTFTTANWNAPQTVTVTGQNDALADGNQTYAVAFGGTASGDPKYFGLVPANVPVTNIDDETAGVSVGAISGPTTEGGGTATFAVVLNSQPTATVVVHLNSNDASEGTVGALAYTFTTANWNTPQTVTITGVNDAVADGNQAYQVTFTATTSTDANYSGITPPSVPVTNVDDETPGVSISPVSGPTTEGGGTATFTVALQSQPTANVTVNFNTNDVSEGTVAVTSLVFTPANWSTAQTVTVTGVDDPFVDGNQPYSIVFTASLSTDGNYNGMVPPSVPMTNVDDD